MPNIYTSLSGTEADDVLTYTSEYDPTTKTLTEHTSIYRLGGNDTVQIESSPALYIDLGEGNDRIVRGEGIWPMPSMTVYGGAGNDVVEYQASEDYNRNTRLDGEKVTTN